MFPASYNWVLGVEATEPSGWNAWFSNYDPTGPVIFDGRPYGSIFFNDMEFNYEVRAPGLSLLSTVPNGQYRYYSGTSMATPVVAGAVALMKNHQSDLSIEQIFAKLIQLNKLSMFQADVLDIPNSILNEPPPDLYFQSFAVTDSLGDQDGRIDAGEMVGLYMKIMNAGGHINNVWGKVTFAEFEDTLTLNFIDDSVSFGNISAYASKVSEMPITFTTNPNLTDGRYVSLQLLTMYEKNNTIDTIVSPFTILVENGVELGGNYSKLRLIPGVHYIVTDPCFFDTLIVDPGVTVKFRSNMYFYVYNQVKAIGSPDSMITFTGALGAYYRGFYLVDGCDNHFEYCVFENGRNEYLVGHYLSNVTKIYHSIFRYHVTDMPIILTRNGGDYKYNVFQDNYNTYVYHMALIGYEDNASFEYNIIANNKALEYWHNGVAMASLYDYTPIMQGNIKHNVFIDNSGSNSWDFAINHSFESINYIESNYWGTTNLNDIRSNILDFFEQPQRPVLEPINNLYQPPEECHGVVWKIEINVQNPQDFEDYLIIDDVMKVDVYFNRPMDTYYDPFVTFGVRFPFTQNQVIDSAYWSADSTVWTAYHTTSLSTGDGINTIRVAHARDTDHFEIPIERSRFKFVVQVAGSQSVDFIATPGISKVTLGWPVETGTDVLGYNFYRFQMENGYPIGDTLLINESLVTDSLYIDFEVLPDETYYYMFTQMKTDFSESDYSKVVSATPFSAANGDANGDMTVNVLDITTIVSYILNQNPEPFLSDAADVNYDGQINLLDIIGVVNLIMNQKAVSDRPYPMISQQKAYYEWRGHELWLHSEGNVAGLQFELALPEGIDSDQLRIKSRLTGFELATAKQSNSIQAILFSLDGKTIPAGESRLLELIGPELPAELQFNSIIGGELEGDQVEVLPFGIDDLPEQSADQQMLQVQPNPFSHQLLISWDVPEANTVALRLYDQQGRMIKSLYEGQDILGSIYWEGKDQRNNTVSKGVYILKMEIQHKEGLRTVERKVIFN